MTTIVKTTAESKIKWLALFVAHPNWFIQGNSAYKEYLSNEFWEGKELGTPSAWADFPKVWEDKLTDAQKHLEFKLRSSEPLQKLKLDILQDDGNWQSLIASSKL